MSYRNNLDKKRQEIFDWLVFEVAGMREKTLVNHPDHTEAMLMNIWSKWRCGTKAGK